MLKGGLIIYFVYVYVIYTNVNYAHLIGMVASGRFFENFQLGVQSGI